MEVLKARLKAVLARLTKNEGLDREQQRRGLDHEGRIRTLEHQMKQRVKTLDADE